MQMMQVFWIADDANDTSCLGVMCRWCFDAAKQVKGKGIFLVYLAVFFCENRVLNGRVPNGENTPPQQIKTNNTKQLKIAENSKT